MGSKKLSAKELLHQCDPLSFDFETTHEISDLTEFVGQKRALDAAHFGVTIKRDGYNMYVLGPSGFGKHSVIRNLLEHEAEGQNSPSDWCYVHNFNEVQKPLALQLPTGWGPVLRQDMEALIEDLSIAIPAIFETEEYRARIQEITDEYNKKQQKLFLKLEAEAKEDELVILTTPQGFAVAPTKKGKIITAKEFEKIPESDRDKKRVAMGALSKKLSDFPVDISRLQKERREKEKVIQREFTLVAVQHFIDDLKKKYLELPLVNNYLTTVQQDIVNNVKDFIKSETTILGQMTTERALNRYKVNVVVSNGHLKGAPVVYEDNPTYSNLVGRVEYLSQYGALVTDFTLIRAGGLHKANGGYLLIDVVKVLTNPFAWQSLKRILYSHKITIESINQMVGLVNTVTLEPEPIPLDIKVILFGDRLFYYLLCLLDSDFTELFKVEVDFEDRVSRDPEAHHLYAQLIATLARKETLSPFHRDAVARIIDHSSRIVGDAEKLSTHMRSIIDVMRESDYWAKQSNREIITREDVQQAIDQKIYRSARMRNQLYESVERGFVLIDTENKTVGQINGLFVMQLGDFLFGHPARITVSTRLGSGKIIDIQREVKMAGPIHSKGVLILSGFLSGRYVRELPLSLLVSLVFEQSYGIVEGDSASIAELCAILSSLADLPIKQSLAVTGSINQHGEIQAVGGINEKIEGFFDICQQKGLNGHQGVLIPRSNVKNLMLRSDVVEAVENKKFSIYVIDTIDDAISLLTDVPAGERKKDGGFPRGSVNEKVETRLRHYASKASKLKKLK